MDWLHQYLLRLGWYRSSLERTRHLVLPGLQGLTLFDLGREYYGELLKDSIFMKSSALLLYFNSVILLAGFDLDTSLQICLARKKVSRPKAEICAWPLRNTIRQ